jgi:hypothetical protein
MFKVSYMYDVRLVDAGFTKVVNRGCFRGRIG